MQQVMKTFYATILGRCTKSSDCRQNEQGFCNLAFVNFGYCLKCRDLSESCDYAPLVKLNSVEDCKKACEGISKQIMVRYVFFQISLLKRNISYNNLPKCHGLFLSFRKYSELTLFF